MLLSQVTFQSAMKITAIALKSFYRYFTCYGYYTSVDYYSLQRITDTNGDAQVWYTIILCRGQLFIIRINNFISF